MKLYLITYRDKNWGDIGEEVHIKAIVDSKGLKNKILKKDKDWHEYDVKEIELNQEYDCEDVSTLLGGYSYFVDEDWDD